MFSTRMKKLNNIKRQLVFDGDQEDFNQLITFKIEDKDLETKISDLVNNPLKNISDDPQFDLQEIVSIDRYRLKEGIIKHYLSEENLRLYYINNEDFLIILSFGEWQPSRYIVNIESVWVSELRRVKSKKL